MSMSHARNDPLQAVVNSLVPMPSNEIREKCLERGQQQFIVFDVEKIRSHLKNKQYHLTHNHEDVSKRSI